MFISQFSWCWYQAGWFSLVWALTSWGIILLTPGSVVERYTYIPKYPFGLCIFFSVIKFFFLKKWARKTLLLEFFFEQIEYKVILSKFLHLCRCPWATLEYSQKSPYIKFKRYKGGSQIHKGTNISFALKNKISSNKKLNNPTLGTWISVLSPSVTLMLGPLDSDLKALVKLCSPYIGKLRE